VLQNVLAGAKVTGLVALVALGFSVGDGSWSHLEPGAIRSAAACCGAGPRDVQLLGLERCVVRRRGDPRPAAPAAAGPALGTGAVVALYIALNLLYVYSLPAAELAGLSGSVLDVIGRACSAPRAGDLLAALTAVSIAASVSAMTIAGPRVYFAMARDGAFFRRAAVIHPRFRTPSAAIGAQALWSILLVLTGSFDQLITYTGFAVVLFSGAAGVALFVLRRRAGEAPPVDIWATRTCRRSSSSPARSSS
jgi:APA family basic amino acid/polyamine antiporter